MTRSFFFFFKSSNFFWVCFGIVHSRLTLRCVVYSFPHIASNLFFISRKFSWVIVLSILHPYFGFLLQGYVGSSFSVSIFVISVSLNTLSVFFIHYVPSVLVLIYEVMFFLLFLILSWSSAITFHIFLILKLLFHVLYQFLNVFFTTEIIGYSLILFGVGLSFCYAFIDVATVFCSLVPLFSYNKFVSKIWPQYFLIVCFYVNLVFLNLMKKVWFKMFFTTAQISLLLFLHSVKNMVGCLLRFSSSVSLTPFFPGSALYFISIVPVLNNFYSTPGLYHV